MPPAAEVSWPTATPSPCMLLTHALLGMHVHCLRHCTHLRSQKRSLPSSPAVTSRCSFCAAKSTSLTAMPWAPGISPVLVMLLMSHSCTLSPAAVAAMSGRFWCSVALHSRCSGRDDAIVTHYVIEKQKSCCAGREVGEDQLDAAAQPDI